MSKAHTSIKYKYGLPYDNTYDVISKVDFVNGEDVVLCREHSGLISVRSLQANDYICPFCKKELDASTLNIIGVSSSGNSGKEPPQSDVSSPAPWAWGWGALVMLLCLVASVVIVFNAFGNGTSTPAPETVRVYSPTATRVIKPPTQVPPRPTATKYVSPPSSSSSSSSSSSGSSCSISVTKKRVPDKGYVLTITPCSGSTYDSTLLPDGEYAVSPNKKFIVYVSKDYDGTVYVAKIGSPNFKMIGRLRQDHHFGAFSNNESPEYRLTLTDSSLTIYEADFKNTATYTISNKYSQ